MFNSYDETNMQFAAALKHLMKKYGYSLRGLASETGIPHTTLHEYIHCTAAPPLANARLIAKALRVTVDAMLGLGESLEKKEAQ